jgi:hypothetical protein
MVEPATTPPTAKTPHALSCAAISKEANSLIAEEIFI